VLPPLPDLDAGGWATGLLAALCIGLTKAGFGGFGLVAVLLMAMILPAKESTGAVLPMLIAADLMAVGTYRKHVSWHDFRKLLPATFLGLLVGWGLLWRLPEAMFGHFLGWMILAMMVLVIWQRADHRILSGILDHPSLVLLSGFFAGITTMVANAGGPAMSFYLLAKKFEKMAFVGTCAWFFFAVNLAKIPMSWSLGLISKSSLLLNLLLLPGVAAGMLAGRLLLGKIPQGLFETLVVVMALASAIKLILS